MQAPHNWHRQRQDQDIGDGTGNAGETGEGDQINAVTALDRKVPNEGDRGTRKAAAKDGDEAEGDACDDEGKMADAPFPGRGSWREDTAVEEQDGNFDKGHCEGPEELVRIHDPRMKLAGRFDWCAGL